MGTKPFADTGRSKCQRSVRWEISTIAIADLTSYAILKNKLSRWLCRLTKTLSRADVPKEILWHC
ncbi:hypothetical protein [Baaleninema simplex]|uniref:hypothetical protein n=1 Tax=Baaleninema simplex TaxID=2862350 RepID=UPI000347395B|nr:hypothetical protein [Baaleninema simplex]